MKNAGAAILACIWLSCPGFSQIYKWKDKDGHVVISTVPPPPGVTAEKRDAEKPRPTPKANPPANVALPESDFKRPFKDIKVVMYVTEWCTYCRKAKAFLGSLGVNPVEYDVEKDPEKQKEQLRKTGGKTGVPVIDVEGHIEVGFNPAKLRAALEERRRTF